jgi:RHS repeat-associated protein
MVVAVEPNPFKHSRTDPDRRVSPHPEPPESRRRSQRARGMGYTAFGTAYAPNTSVEVEQRYTYTGREKTTDPTLMYYRWRMYGAGIGRFVQRDPIYGLARTQKLPEAFFRELEKWDHHDISSALKNQYLYPDKKSLSKIDPFGLGSIVQNSNGCPCNAKSLINRPCASSAKKCSSQYTMIFHDVCNPL